MKTTKEAFKILEIREMLVTGRGHLLKKHFHNTKLIEMIQFLSPKKRTLI
jgi:hypothetical protein